MHSLAGFFTHIVIILCLKLASFALINNSTLVISGLRGALKYSKSYTYMVSTYEGSSFFPGPLKNEKRPNLVGSSKEVFSVPFENLMR